MQSSTTFMHHQRRPATTTTCAYLSGVFSGLAACFLIVSMHLLWRICEWVWPKSSIEVCPDVVHLLNERQRNKSSSI